MLKKEKQIYILKKAKRGGRAITDDLVEELGVAEGTIREGFQELSKKGLVRGIHGGVLRMENNIIDFNERITMNPTIKQQFAMKATELISGKSVVYIDGGTTNLKFVESLPKDRTGIIITNSPAIVLTLCEYKNAKINSIDGKLDPATRITKGTSSIKRIETMDTECCILGISSPSPENGITFPSFGEAELKKELITRSSQIIVIANKEKLGDVSAFPAADISAVDILVTSETNEGIIRSYSKRGPQVIVYNVDQTAGWYDEKRQKESFYNGEISRVDYHPFLDSFQRSITLNIGTACSKMNSFIYNPPYGPQLIVYDVNELCIKGVQSIVRPPTIRLYMEQLILNPLVNIPNLRRLLKKQTMF